MRQLFIVFSILWCLKSQIGCSQSNCKIPTNSNIVLEVENKSMISLSKTILKNNKYFIHSKGEFYYLAEKDTFWIDHLLVDLHFSFSAKKNDSLLIDGCFLSKIPFAKQFLHPREGINIIDTPITNNSCELFDKFSYFALVIENSKGLFAYFNDKDKLPPEDSPKRKKNLDVFYLYNFQRYGPCPRHRPVYGGEFESLAKHDLTPQKQDLFSRKIFISDLQILEDDDEIRLHYVFVPTQEHREMGFKDSYIITSNWFKLYVDKVVDWKD